MLLRAKGETPGEIAGLARAMLDKGLKVNTSMDGEGRGKGRMKGKGANLILAALAAMLSVLQTAFPMQSLMTTALLPPYPAPRSG